MAEYAVEVDNLTYTFGESSEAAVTDINLKVPWNTRTLVVGANGAGKSTLLKLLSGKHLCLNGKIKVNGLDPFSPHSMVTELNRDLEENDDGFGNRSECQVSTYLGTEWCHMSIINRDIGVLELLDSIGYQYFKQRGDRLIDILDIDVAWRMHRLSDGQKRRVQLVMGLLKPWRVLLLDEVTVDLDVIARSRLLDFLKWETQNRKCSVVYATHIFDGLAAWPDFVFHMQAGKIVSRLDYKNDVKFRNATEDSEANGKVVVHENGNRIDIVRLNSLHPLAIEWLKGDHPKISPGL
ncbi:CCR4-associated factor 16 [Nakaseomyces bracarensis]|uniref:CCR4-associated factor 16 n=1 Tax=Nakaseomyces bracarensis TaxID=273131 RepID=A0ABR4NP89_9SACH